tara:strand:- start:859 stop:1074 length:216 start_codon:yes stop_codon:yes gene_type:complete
VFSSKEKEMEKEVRVQCLELIVSHLKKGADPNEVLDHLVKRFSDEPVELLVNIICDVYSISAKEFPRRNYD